MRKLFYTSFVIATLIFSGCSLNKMIQMADQQQLTVTPSPLEVHADSVNFEMSAVLPVKMLQKGKVYTVNTFYKYGADEIALESIEFNADQYPNASTQQPRTSKSWTLAYDPAMKSGVLEVEGVALDPKNGKTQTTPRLKVADGIITTSKLAQNVYYAAYADHGYNNAEELKPTNVEFYFEQGRSNLRRSERRSDRGKYFEAFVAEKNVTRTVTITGTHSPEGTETINSGLSNDRASVIEDYYTAQMKRYDYKGMADSVKFILKPIVEDWADFKAKLADYDGISSDQKSGYLDIVNGPGTFEEKEKALQKLGSYKKVFDNIYPGLRTAKTEILTVKNKKSDAEISVLSKQLANEEVSADTLSDQELMYGASLTPSLAEKEGIYKAATKKNDSWNSHNNLGAVYVEMAMANSAEMNKYAEMAITQLEISNNRKENAEAYINLGTAHLMQGNIYAALAAMQKGVSMGPNADQARGAKGVLGVLQIMTANYDQAEVALSNSEETSVNLFNKGLAQVLNKDYENALTSFGDAASSDGDNAWADYGAAIANARLGNNAEAVTSLTSAVGKNPDLKQAALNDLEFRNLDLSTALN